MMYLVIVLVSPLYFIFRKKWGAFILNTVLYLLGWVTIRLFGMGIIFWLLGIGYVAWHLRKELKEEQAQMIANEMVAKMKETKSA